MMIPDNDWETVIRYANPEDIDVANYIWKYLQADYNDYIY